MSCRHYFTLLPGSDVSMVTVASCWTGLHVLCSTCGVSRRWVLRIVRIVRP